jgi:hypothetical protein
MYFSHHLDQSTSINILENNVTLIDTSVDYVVKLTCKALTRNTGTQVLCLAISSPTTKILTYIGKTFTST